MAYSLKPHTFIIIFIFLFIAIAGGLYQVHIYQQQQDKIHTQQRKAEQAQKERIHAELDELFNQYLTSFQTDLQEKATAYKNSRTILKEILTPYNFETKEYTKENYLLFKDNVAPDLRNKAADIINVFVEYKNNLQTDLKSQNNKTQEMFLLKWQEMSDKQLDKYIEFFTKEEALIQAYEKLITFYYVHSNLFSVDVEENMFLFNREDDKKAELTLRAKIKALRKK
ncbi:MAG: hypothetical protein COB14_08320 [Alphaproteobacteria bacterium]|nr:MAG: hypothetical protein COB14_08320 [Alphaproteobacteria bacterium]